MSTPLQIDDDRLLPAGPAERSVARRLLSAVEHKPIISPHGHVEAAFLARNDPLPDPAALLVTPDHYITRLLHASGVPLGELGVSASASPSTASARVAWALFCSHWYLFRGTPSRYWLEYVLVEVLGITRTPSAATADALFDEITDRLSGPAFRPRALFERFNIELLATTDDPCDDLAAHRRIRDDALVTGRVLPTFRPDAYVNPQGPEWPGAVRRLGATADVDTGSHRGLVEALRRRREYFRAFGATSSDHGTVDVACEPVDDDTAERLHRACLDGSATTGERTAYRGHLLFTMAALAAEDGMVMQLHPGVLRNHHRPTGARFGPNTGHDLPLATEFVRSLRPILERFGTSSSLRLLLFTVDESTFSRELAPLAGFYPTVYLGAPWWFLDTHRAMHRFRSAVTDSAGFYKTAGFVDDTRAFCSIPARHDMARRADAGYLADLVCRHELTEDEATETLLDIVDSIPRHAFRLPDAPGASGSAEERGTPTP